MAIEPSVPLAPRPSLPQATIADWLALPPEVRAELLEGRLVHHALPGPLHGVVTAQLAGVLAPRFHRRQGDAERPGGWWLSQEVDLELGGAGCRPDLLGWRRADHPRMPEADARGLVTVVPGWICEVLSPSTASLDLGVKRDVYHRAGVPWYWLADPLNRTLTVLRHVPEGYVVALAGGSGDRLRADPFEAVEVTLDDVFDFDAP